jgi:hypothetical protein
MGNLVFLGGALVISAVGSVILWLLHRKPTSMEAGIDAFSRELQALAPQRPHQHVDPRGGADDMQTDDEHG